MREIGNCAFGGCKNLSKVVIPVGFRDYFLGMDGLKNQKDVIHEENSTIIDLPQEENLNDITKSAKYIFFDTETTGIPRDYKASIQDTDNWPRLVQLAWILTDKDGNELKRKSAIIYPDGFTIPTDSVEVHGITTERAKRDGLPLQEVLEEFMQDFNRAKEIVGHNIDFDQHIVGAELYRLNMAPDLLMDKTAICTMKSSTDFCAIPNPNSYYGGYKWPTLQELYYKLFNRNFEEAHDALADITATKECFFERESRNKEKILL